MAVTKTISEITINNIRIGGKAPKSIWKGSKEVKEVRKGSTVVYKKENVTYTLARGNETVSNKVVITNLIVDSFKGNRAAYIPITATVLSGNLTVTVRNNGKSNMDIQCKINDGANNTTTARVYKFRLTQDVSGLTVDVTLTQLGRSAYYLTLRKLGFRFSGSMPSQGFDLGVSTVVMGVHGTHYEDFWGEDSGQTVGGVGGSNWIDGARLSNIDSNGNTGVRNYVYYNNNQQQGEGSNSHTWGPMVKNGDTFSAAFYFGGTWAGTSAYQGYTWYFHVKQFSNNYIKPATSSKYWEVGTQPCYIGVTTTFQNITSDKTVDLIVDFNWSWSNYWSSSM